MEQVHTVLHEQILFFYLTFHRSRQKMIPVYLPYLLQHPSYESLPPDLFIFHQKVIRSLSEELLYVKNIHSVLLLSDSRYIQYLEANIHLRLHPYISLIPYLYNNPPQNTLGDSFVHDFVHQHEYQ
jgi:hypothetical protein